MCRYCVETWDADRRRCQSVLRCSWPVLTRALGDDPETVGMCRTLCVGESVTIGGGAAPITRITREA
mgnify:CR=1 FL=1